MTNQQILQKAIQKAIDSGWKPGWADKRPIVSWSVDYSTEYDEGEGVVIWGYHAKSNASSWYWPLKELIFNHDFAQHFFGEEPYTDKNNVDLSDYKEGTTNDGRWTDKGSYSTGLDGVYLYRELPAWQYHLQQMVISEDPIKYLGEHLDG